jgi:hypothetical protein
MKSGGYFDIMTMICVERCFLIVETYLIDNGEACSGTRLNLNVYTDTMTKVR